MDSGTMADVERFFEQADGKPGDPLSPEDEAFLAQHRADIEDMIGEAAVKGAEWESARIRRELLDAIGAKRSEWALAKPLGEEGVKTDRDIGADAAFASVLAALDRICPEEE